MQTDQKRDDWRGQKFISLRRCCHLCITENTSSPPVQNEIDSPEHNQWRIRPVSLESLISFDFQNGLFLSTDSNWRSHTELFHDTAGLDCVAPQQDTKTNSSS